MQFIWPLDNHTISRNFYYLGSIYIGGQHMAIDIPASTGTPVKAVAAGKVLAAGYSSINGNYVEIAHTGGWRTKYRHFVEPAVVGVGVSVSQGQVIGKVGSTGWSTGPHLHLDLWNAIKQSPEAVYKGNIFAHDPEIYLGKEEDMTQDEFNRLFREAVKSAPVAARDNTGKLRSGAHPLAEWLEKLRVHDEDEAKHDGEGGLKRGDKVTLS
ncbi:hypothetical protein LCGC14_1559330 [marine sediment metagenome]|uniref:M23ase beta-sheet core domain-containing protein n=1 Tax=marine sediment metagenome TaxID=412755 RepID=A0A0F9L4E0_9ZZZZ